MERAKLKKTEQILERPKSVIVPTDFLETLSKGKDKTMPQKCRTSKKQLFTEKVYTKSLTHYTYCVTNTCIIATVLYRQLAKLSEQVKVYTQHSNLL